MSHARILCSLILIFIVTACASTPPTATPLPRQVVSPTIVQTRVTLKMEIRDKVTRQPLVASKVFLNDELIFENVSYYEARLPGDTRQKPARIRVEVPGYVPWEQHYEYFWRTNKVYEFPANMVKEE